MALKFLLGCTFSVFLIEKQCKKTTESIMLEYWGPQNKPLNSVIFYNDTFERPISPYFKEFKVPKKCLKEIADTITSTKGLEYLEKGELGYYTVIIRRKKRNVRLFAGNTSAARNLQMRIVSAISDTTIRHAVDQEFKKISDQFLMIGHKKDTKNKKSRSPSLAIKNIRQLSVALYTKSYTFSCVGGTMPSAWNPPP